jgi:hypothetical protein
MSTATENLADYQYWEKLENKRVLPLPGCSIKALEQAIGLVDALPPSVRLSPILR